MRQTILSLLFLLQGLVITAQDHEATMHFIDGTDVTGYASIKFVKESFYGLAKDKISFRVTPEGEAEFWDETEVSKIVFHDFGEPITFEYINVTYIDGDQASLFEVLLTGEVTLYAEAVGVWDAKTDKVIPPMPKNLRAKRADEKDFAILTNKKKIAAYFSQCPGILERLESGEFNRSTVQEMVTFYNESCPANVAGTTDKTKNNAPVGE